MPALVDDKCPTPDPAEDNAFFPSPYSLSQFTAPKSDLAGADYPHPYTGKRWKVLMIGADERYVPMDNVLGWEAAAGKGQQVSLRRA